MNGQRKTNVLAGKPAGTEQPKSNVAKPLGRRSRHDGRSALTLRISDPAQQKYEYDRNGSAGFAASGGSAPTD